MRNGISVAALSELAREVEESPEEGLSRFGAEVTWKTGTTAALRTQPMLLGPHRVQREFTWGVDEPRQLLGVNAAPNPAEYLLGAVGACMMVTFAVGASVRGIQLESLRIEVEGDIDLAGFLGVREDAPAAFTAIRYRITVDGTGTREDFEAVRRQALRHSPNVATIARAVPLSGELVILGEARAAG